MTEALYTWLVVWAFLACCGLGKAATDADGDPLRWALSGIAFGWLWPAAVAFEVWQMSAGVWRRRRG